LTVKSISCPSSMSREESPSGSSRGLKGMRNRHLTDKSR
jgi:hypothetical protein